MSKDTPATQTSSQLITHPPNNMVFGMGFPFPIIHPQMGQFIPMGMLPINSNAMQQYMDVASKSGFGPAMVASMIGSSNVIPPNMFLPQGEAKLSNDFASMSQMESEQNQARDQIPGNLVSTQEVTRTISSSNVHSIGGDRTPILPMPSVFFLPFTPGDMTQYIPNYPTFNAVTTPKKDDIPPRDHKPEQGVSLPNKCDEAKDSDELDVARILVDMQIPVLKKINSQVTTSGSQSLTVKQDLNPVRIVSDQNISSNKDVKNSILQASVSKDILSDAKPQNGVDVLINTTPAFQHHHEQDDKNLEKPFPNRCDISNVNDQCGEKGMVRECESLYPDEVRPEEMELEEKEVEDPADMKLEVISEGEICKPELIHLMDDTGHDQAIPNDVKVKQTPDYSDFDSLGHRSKDRCLLEQIEESPCIKREVMDISSDQNPDAEPTVLLSSAINSCSSGVQTTSFPSEQSIADLEKESALKQDSPEKQKDKLEEVRDMNSEPADELSGDENGLSRKVYKCDVCSQLFRSPLGLQKHIEFHNMDDGHEHYTCTICFMHFCNDTALQEHHEKHMRKRPHKCEFCPKAFRDPGSLQKHVRVHTGEKPYNCKDCHRSFAEYSSLRKHQRVHTGEQPYKCKYCSKAFSISGNLQRHILIHTGERPYKCNFCTKAFNNPSHLRRHVKNLHFKGDSAIDEAMLSHYGNPGATKNSEIESSLQTNAEEMMKQELQAVTNVDSREPDVPITKSLELGTKSVIIQAL